MYYVNFSHCRHPRYVRLQPLFSDGGHPLYGTGDVFAGVLTGGLVKGEPLFTAARRAAEFVRACAVRTVAQDLPLSEGVDFEPLLGTLMNR